MQRLRAPVLAVLMLTAGSALSRAAPADPWPDSPALIRLYRLPAGRADGERLARDLALRPAQVGELRRLAELEAALSRAGRQVLGRAEAARFNARLAALRAEKDRRVRAALGEKYPAFRDWLREWWAGQVSAARGRSR